MANKEISELTAAAALDGTELVHVVQGGNSRKTTVSNSTAFLLIDEDSFATNSATKAPSQQSAKAYIEANAKIQLQTAVATTSGTSVDVTSIPAGVKRITICLSEVSTSGSSMPLIRIGDSGGVETTGYLGVVMSVNPGGASGTTLVTDGLGLDRSGSAGIKLNGTVVLTLMDASTNKWTATSSMSDSATAFINNSSTSKALSAELDRVRLTTSGGVNTFDLGSMSVSWEF